MQIPYVICDGIPHDPPLEIHGFDLVFEVLLVSYALDCV